MLGWNVEASVGKFASASQPQIAASPPKHRALLSDAPIETIWLRMRRLASVTLARKLLHARAVDAGIELDADDLNTKAEGVAFATRNAIDYFQLESVENTSQRVLNLYYGSMSFAFAEMLALPNGPKSLAQIEEVTKQGHGLYTIDGKSDDLGSLVVGVIASGFFPAWMKAMGLSTSALPSKKARRYDDLSAKSPDSWQTVEQLFARIPEIGDLFIDVFDSKPGWVRPTYDQRGNGTSLSTKTKASTTYSVFVDSSARMTCGDIARFPGPISQIKELQSQNAGRHFRVAVDTSGEEIWWNALPLHESPFAHAALVMPIFGSVHEYRAISVVLLYALSIIVRYRPGLWRRVQEGDLDHVRVLIEAFLSMAERLLPEKFLASITGEKISVKQPGSFF